MDGGREGGREGRDVPLASRVALPRREATRESSTTNRS